ncbi:hypothetical protein BLNAU_9195 [Blattamonas nauphoetae]|uniref:Uncharacterized protein n=1 Tax=Blattamonas nauphoetae TaxID=2049346 RepID=A0ABQ9XWH5_9EUKA|nr:hypothetical protein BLNAU_9195 [Blattamonas nauphoetae]
MTHNTAYSPHYSTYNPSYHQQSPFTQFVSPTPSQSVSLNPNGFLLISGDNVTQYPSSSIRSTPQQSTHRPRNTIPAPPASAFARMRPTPHPTPQYFQQPHQFHFQPAFTPSPQFSQSFSNTTITPPEPQYTHHSDVKPRHSKRVHNVPTDDTRQSSSQPHSRTSHKFDPPPLPEISPLGSYPNPSDSFHPLPPEPPLFTTSIPPPLYYSPPLQQTRIVERRGLWEHTEDEEEEEEYEEEEKDDSAEEEEDSYEGTRGYSVEEDPTASRGGYLPPDLWELLQSFQPEKQPTLKEMRDRTRSSMQEDGEWIGFPYEKIEINEPPSDISPILLDA